MDIPESPDTCSHLVDIVETEIASRLEQLKTLQDESSYIIHEVCLNLDETVTKIIEDNMASGHQVSTRLGLLLQDISNIEGN